MVVLTSQVQHFVVHILIMVVIDLDVTEVAAEYNDTATDVEVSAAKFTFTICRTCLLALGHSHSCYFHHNKEVQNKQTWRRPT